MFIRPKTINGASILGATNATLRPQVFAEIQASISRLPMHELFAVLDGGSDARGFLSAPRRRSERAAPVFVTG
jgi:hypothetical protein